MERNGAVQVIFHDDLEAAEQLFVQALLTCSLNVMIRGWPVPWVGRRGWSPHSQLDASRPRQVLPCNPVQQIKRVAAPIGHLIDYVLNLRVIT